MILQSGALPPNQLPPSADTTDPVAPSLARESPRRHPRPQAARLSQASRLRNVIVAGTFVATVLTGCDAGTADIPVIGSPDPTLSAQPTVTPGRPAQLRARWGLTGIDLPSDWPDVPVPQGTQVASAYAVDSPPRRTWTASFVGDSGTALELAQPVAEALSAAGYQPVSAYSTKGDGNAGLFGFSGDQYSVYLVLGELDGKPNVLMTVRQRGAETSGSASPSSPRATAASPSTAPKSPVSAPTGASRVPSGPANTAAPSTSPHPSSSRLTAPGPTANPSRSQ